MCLKIFGAKQTCDFKVTFCLNLSILSAEFSSRLTLLSVDKTAESHVSSLFHLVSYLSALIEMLETNFYYFCEYVFKVSEHCERTLGVGVNDLPVVLRLNPVSPHVVAVNSTSSPLDPSLDLVVLLHGFTGSVNSKSVTLIRNALLYKLNVTVVAVQWARLARGPWYDEAAGNTLVVAQHLVNFLLKMEQQGLDFERVHVIGFSLGAHIAGFTGAFLQGRLGRITGLDPARPGFDKRNSSGRLDASDAQFVDVVHTGAGFVAMGEPVGHVDFYPNGGSKQPHCQSEDIPLVCNHFMAYTYFAESIYEANAFPARKCSSWADFDSGLCDANTVVPMGYYTPNQTLGLHYLKTNAQEPYGLGVADHRVNFDINQSNSATAPSNQDLGNTAPPGDDSDHHKDIYSVNDGASNPDDLEVRSLNDLDTRHLSSCSAKLHHCALHIIYILFFIFCLLP